MNEFFSSIVPNINWFTFLLLALFGGIYWCYEKTSSFQILFLSLISLCVGTVATQFFPSLIINDELVPFATLPLLQFVSVISFYYIYGSENKERFFIYFLIPIFLGIIFVIFQYIHILTMMNSIIIGGFVVFTFRRSEEWLGGMPEPLLLTIAFAIPFFFAIMLYPHETGLFYSGMILGTSVGTIYELSKLRFTYRSIRLREKMIALLLGNFGLLLIASLQKLINFLPLGTIIHGALIGIWIYYIVPYILISFNIYRTEATGSIL